MRIIFLILAYLYLFFGGGYVFANDPPSLLNPSNNSTASSSKLQWQAPIYSLYSSNPYRVQVDDDPSFASLNKDYYTDNTYYTPSLSDGTWYWRVKAKDVSGSWSNFSDVWSFILSTSTATPTPTVQPSQATQTSPTPQTTQSDSSSMFTISDVPQQINSDQVFNVSVSLSLPGSPNSDFYLKGAFKKGESSNYFGLTQVLGSWVKNSSSYSSQYKITTDSSGSWSGSLSVQVDQNDSGFSGSDSYIFRVGRYTSSGSGPTWTSDSNIQITAVSVNSDEQTQTSKSFGSTNKSSAPPSVNPSSVSTSYVSNSSPKVDYKIASVAGASSFATPSAEVQSMKNFNQSPFNIFTLTGGGLVTAGIGVITFVYLRHKRSL